MGEIQAIRNAIYNISLLMSTNKPYNSAMYCTLRWWIAHCSKREKGRVQRSSEVQPMTRLIMNEMKMS